MGMSNGMRGAAQQLTDNPEIPIYGQSPAIRGLPSYISPLERLFVLKILYSAGNDGKNLQGFL